MAERRRRETEGRAQVDRDLAIARAERVRDAALLEACRRHVSNLEGLSARVAGTPGVSLPSLDRDLQAAREEVLRAEASLRESEARLRALEGQQPTEA